MAKIDFTKAERLLEEGVHKFNIKQLQYLSGLSFEFGSDQPEERLSPFDDLETKKLLLSSLVQSLKSLNKRDSSAFKELKITKKQMKKYTESPDDLSDEEWEEVAQLRQKFRSYWKKLREEGEIPSDEELIKGEQKKHETKRFNINDDWLPLH